MRVGLTLPSFVEDPKVPVAVARAAETAGLHGVFAYDHLFRIGADGERRPALECTALLGALAVETSEIGLGTLVVRATMRPPATLAVALDTLRRIAGPRLFVGVGAGDSESRPEMDAFGLPFGTETDRVMALRRALRATRDRGYPVWVGGRSRHVGLIAAEGADGWNRWGASVERFGEEAAEVRALAQRVARSPALFTVSWGGLVALAATDAQAREKAERLGAGPGVIVGGPETVAEVLRAYAAAGASWLILGPLDSSNPENASLIGEAIVPLLT